MQDGELPCPYRRGRSLRRRSEVTMLKEILCIRARTGFSGPHPYHRSHPNRTPGQTAGAGVLRHNPLRCNRPIRPLRQAYNPNETVITPSNASSLAEVSWSPLQLTSDTPPQRAAS